MSVGCFYVPDTLMGFAMRCRWAVSELSVRSWGSRQNVLRTPTVMDFPRQSWEILDGRGSQYAHFAHDSFPGFLTRSRLVLGVSSTLPVGFQYVFVKDSPTRA